MSQVFKLSACPETLDEAREIIDQQQQRIERYNAALFDGRAVYSQLTEHEKRYTTTENVSAVLDAFKRAMKAIDAARKDTK